MKLESEYLGSVKISESPDLIEEIREIDEALRSDYLHPSLRLMRCVLKLSERRTYPLSIFSEEFTTTCAWYVRMYGDKLRNESNVGQSIVNIGGEPYIIKFPLLYGTLNVNVLVFIRGTTDDMLNSLSEECLDEIAKHITSVYYFVMDLGVIENELFRLALQDLFNSAEHCVKAGIDLVYSMYYSGQAVEKIIKGYFKIRDGEIKSKAHDINSILLQGCRELNIEKSLCTVFNKFYYCQGFRYDLKNLPSMKDCIEAHYNAVEIGKKIIEEYRIYNYKK